LCSDQRKQPIQKCREAAYRKCPLEVLFHNLSHDWLHWPWATHDTRLPECPDPRFPQLNAHNSLRHPTLSENYWAADAQERNGRVVATWRAGGCSDRRAPVLDTASKTPILIGGWPYYDEDRGRGTASISCSSHPPNTRKTSMVALAGRIREGPPVTYTKIGSTRWSVKRHVASHYE
jgi:hypothetical protein